MALEVRFRLWFNFLDVNKDGFLSKEDLTELFSNLSRVYSSRADDHQAVLNDLNFWWTRLRPVAVDGCVSQEQFVHVLKTFAVAEPENFFEIMQGCYCSFFEVIDQDKDKKASLEEFLKFYSVFGVENKVKVARIFKMVDTNNDGCVTKDEWVAANVSFMTRVDENFDYGFLYNVF